MDGGTSLPRHLERLIREQVAIGQFRTKGDVVDALLELLEVSASTEKGPELLQKQTSGFLNRVSAEQPGPSRPRIHGEIDDMAELAMPSVPRRSPRGLLADLRSAITPDEIREARNEMWADLHDGDLRR